MVRPATARRSRVCGACVRVPARPPWGEEWSGGGCLRGILRATERNNLYTKYFCKLKLYVTVNAYLFALKLSICPSVCLIPFRVCTSKGAALRSASESRMGSKCYIRKPHCRHYLFFLLGHRTREKRVRIARLVHVSFCYLQTFLVFLLRFLTRARSSRVVE